MPDVNLLRDTKQPEQPPKPPMRQPGQFEMTDPSAEAKGVGGFFRSLLSRRSPPLGTPAVPRQTGKMSLGGKTTSQERILSETKQTSRPAVIPLPEDDGNYNVNLLSEDLVSTFNPRQKM